MPFMLIFSAHFLLKLNIRIFLDEPILAKAIKENKYTELCFADSYSICSNDKSTSMLSIQGRLIDAPNLSSDYTHNSVWVIVGIAPHQKNAIYLVNKETVLQYFNQTDKSECKVLKN